MSPKMIYRKPCGAHVDFIKKVRQQKIVETSRYRYICESITYAHFDWEIIARISREYINTPKMLAEDNWQLVKVTNINQSILGGSENETGNNS